MPSSTMMLKSLPLLFLAVHESLAVTPDFCLAKGFNEELNAENVFEVDLDLDAVKNVRADYEKDVLPYLETGHSTDDFCLTSPYNSDTSIWDEGDGHVKRSDMKWYAAKNEETFQRYMKHTCGCSWTKDLGEGSCGY